MMARPRTGMSCFWHSAQLSLRVHLMLITGTLTVGRTPSHLSLSPLLLHFHCSHFENSLSLIQCSRWCSFTSTDHGHCNQLRPRSAAAASVSYTESTRYLSEVDLSKLSLSFCCTRYGPLLYSSPPSTYAGGYKASPVHLHLRLITPRKSRAVNRQSARIDIALASLSTPIHSGRVFIWTMPPWHYL